jgi:hypothetical protein
MIKILTALVVGGASGAIAALAGVGGGILLVPAFVFILGLEQKEAVATSLAVIVLTSLSATARNFFNDSASPADLIQWQIMLPTAIGAVIVAWFAADALRDLSNQTLRNFFGVVMIVAGFVIFFKK